MVATEQRKPGAIRIAVILALLIGTATAVVASGASVAADDKGTSSQKKNKDNGKKGKPGSGNPGTAKVVKADVLQWLVANNPGLRPDFLRTEPPDRTVKLPDGTVLPIYRLVQFHEVNFRLTFFARKQEKGSDVVAVMEARLKKLMCLPDYREFILHHRNEYKINGKHVSALEAYNHFRHIDRRLGVTAGEQYKAPVGGGDGIAAPSWVTWKAMNIFHHEACHCIGIGHDSGGLSGPLSGALRKWDRQKKWNYTLVNLDTQSIR